MALETYNLKEQLARTREELATALYQHDAAVRVIARLTRERDEARDALSKVTVTDGTAGGEEMVVDSVEKLPEDLAANVDETHKRWVSSFFLGATSDTNVLIAYPRDARSGRFLKAGSLQLRYPHLRPRLRTTYPCHKRLRSLLEKAPLQLVD